jgi:hypothetical protein
MRRIQVGHLARTTYRIAIPPRDHDDVIRWLLVAVGPDCFIFNSMRGTFIPQTALRRI